jgi:hypothetical protein
MYGATLHGYDFGLPGDPNRLTADEAYRSRRINSRITRAESEQLAQRALDAAWHEVPEGADLADADPAVASGLFTKMARLYWHFTWPEQIHGIRVAKVHKVLHPKRPALYPLLDAQLKRLYAPQAAAWLNQLEHLEDLTTSDSPPYWAAIRDDLVVAHDSLEHHRIRLAESDDPALRTMAQLTRLRLLDVIAWTVATGSR